MSFVETSAMHLKNVITISRRNKRLTYLDLLYSNSMCKQSSMPTSILMLVFISGYWESECTAMSISRTRSDKRRTIVTRSRYLRWDNTASHARSYNTVLRTEPQAGQHRYMAHGFTRCVIVTCGTYHTDYGEVASVGELSRHT